MVEDLSGNPTFMYNQDTQEISFCLSQPTLLVVEDFSYVISEDNTHIIIEEGI